MATRCMDDDRVLLRQALKHTIESVVVVNEALVRIHVPDRRAIGRDLFENNVHRRIVGVVADIKETSLMEGPVPPISQSVPQLLTSGAQSMLSVGWTSCLFVLVTSRLPAALLSNAVKQVGARVDRTLAIEDVHTLQACIDQSIGRTTLAAALLGVLALVAIQTALAGLP